MKCQPEERQQVHEEEQIRFDAIGPIDSLQKVQPTIIGRLARGIQASLRSSQ
jgi:hypothetical protein